jgi:hypothetical protein
VMKRQIHVLYLSPASPAFNPAHMELSEALYTLDRLEGSQ